MVFQIYRFEKCGKETEVVTNSWPLGQRAFLILFRSDDEVIVNSSSNSCKNQCELQSVQTADDPKKLHERFASVRLTMSFGV